jgi:hypothetical protein
MDLLEKMLPCGTGGFRKRWFGGLLPFVLLLAGLVPVHGYAPTLLLGLYGGEICSDDEGGQTALGAGGLLSWRTLIAENASIALYARSSVDRSVTGSRQFYDFQTLSLETRVRGEAGGIFIEGGLNGSFNGTLEGQLPYVRPDWRIGWERGGDDSTASVAYSGYYLSQPEGTEDALFQGLALGVSKYPSIRSRYGLEIRGGWEIWTEENRDDLLGALKASTGGLIGYFHDWAIAAEGGVRWSEEKSESNLFLAIGGDWAWSPHRQVSVELGCFARGEIYYQEESLPDAPHAFSTGIELRGDWTPNDRLFFVTELSAARRFASVSAESWWNLFARAGIELSL